MPRSCSDAFYFHLVYEYLVHMGMDSTSRRMLEECDVYGYPIPYLSEMGVSMEEINRLLQYFDDENCADFFKDFEMAVPANIQNSTDCRKLKLGLHVFFAVTGLRYEKEVPFRGENGSSGSSDRHTDRQAAIEDVSIVESNGKKKNCNPACPCKNPHCMCRADGGSIEEKACIKSRKYCKEGRPDSSRQLAHPCMATLLAFLEKDGSELSKEPELLPYFALPFILEPEAHPHYEHLFKPPWASNLRRWLWNFLISHRQASRVPELVLLLPDLHSALSGRAGRGISTIMPRVHGSCPSSDHEICMNHVTSNMHGKQRLRQYCPKDPHAVKSIETSSAKKVAREQEEKPEDGLTPEVTDSANRKPVTFHHSKEPPEHEDTEGTAGSQVRPARKRPDEEGCERILEDADCCNQSCLMYGSLRSRYNQLHNDYHNLLGVAAELTDALENCVRGENIDLKKTLENCSHLFPELMKMHEHFTESSDRAKQTPLQTPKHETQTPKQNAETPLHEKTEPMPTEVVIETEEQSSSKTVEVETESPDDTIHATTKSNHSNKAHFDRTRSTKPPHESNTRHSEKNLFCTSTMIPLYLMQNSDKPITNITCDLDFKAIKRDLYKGSIKRMILLLQALRWRLTNTSIEQRTTAIESYVASDLMAILPETDRVSNAGSKTVRISEQTTSLLERLLMPCSIKSPHPLQQASSRLINAIASIRKGRNYLVQSPSVVNVHVRTLYEAELDSITSEMVIATLQKLSLRRSQRRLMIESDLVEWLVDQLAANVNNRGVYWLKYTAALLMNLCLHHEARDRCVPLAREILGSITEWMRAAMVDVSASSLSPPAAVLLPCLQNIEGKLHTIPLARMVHISPKALPYLNGAMYTLLSHPEINQVAVEMSLARTLQELVALHEDHEARCQLGHILTHHREQLLADSPTAALSLNQDLEDGKWVLDLLEDELDAADPIQAGPDDLTGENLLCHYYSLYRTTSSDTLDKTQIFMDMPVIDLDECQLPVRSQGSFTTETPLSGNSAKPLILSPDLPECPSPSSVNLEQPKIPPEPLPYTQLDLHDLSSSCPDGTSIQLEPVPSSIALPIVLAGNSPTRLSFTTPARPRTSVTLPSFSTTAIFPPQTASQSSTLLPMSSRPRNSITHPGRSRTAIVSPENCLRNSIVLPSRPRTSFTLTEFPAESSKTAIIMPKASSTRPVVCPVLPETPPACQTDHSAPGGPSLAYSKTSTTFPDAITDVQHESPPTCHETPNAVSEAISTSTGELDLNAGRDNASLNVMPVSYTKQEHVVRCRTPENIEVIVAVTLSPDTYANEERPEHVVRAYKKIVNVIKSPRKELHGSPSKSQQTEHLNDVDVTATEITANSAVPDNPHGHSEPRAPKVCGIWSISDLESDSLKDTSASSQLPKDSEMTKECVFCSRPRIPRTPPQDSLSPRSKADHPQTPPKS